MKADLLELLPNRVRRNYAGGALLDRLEGRASARDGDRPEDWLASTTPAINRGMPEIADEGIGRVRGVDGATHLVTELFARHGEHYLGAHHLARIGPRLGFLAKLLDSSMRLHTQVHPTREFARERLGSPWGKLECYVILGVREGHPANLRLGFQHPPTREAWREIVATQDIARMDACFEPIPTRPGEVWLVPGGMVHALGAGLLLLEVMEPSDLVVRCEFEREGIVVPPEARYMGRDLDFCLDVFDYAAAPVDAVRARCRMQARVLADEPTHREEVWVPASATRCFEVRRLLVRRSVRWSAGGACRLLVVGSGRGRITAREADFALAPASRFFAAAEGDALTIEPRSAEEPLELWICQPAVA
jgi:Phosphomannose isomerase